MNSDFSFDWIANSRRKALYPDTRLYSSFCVAYLHQTLNRLCSKTPVNNTVDWSEMKWNYDKHNLFTPSWFKPVQLGTKLGMKHDTHIQTIFTGIV